MTAVRLMLVVFLLAACGEGEVGKVALQLGGDGCPAFDTGLLRVTRPGEIRELVGSCLTVSVERAVSFAEAYAGRQAGMRPPFSIASVLPVEDVRGVPMAHQVVVAGGNGQTFTVHVAAYLFRHPVRWAHPGPPAWLRERGAPEGVCEGHAEPLAVLPAAGMPGVYEMVRYGCRDGTTRLYSHHADRVIAPSRVRTRHDPIEVFARWTRRLTDKYHDPAARIAQLGNLWASNAAPGRGQKIFLQGATELSVTSVLRPWTQDSACSCCVCWETAMATVLSYWDDYTLGGQGPWEQMMPHGDRDDTGSFDWLSQRLYEESGVDCGAGGWSFFINDDVITASRAVVNTQMGYDFEFDYDEWVWFGLDLEDEIRAGKPVYYGFQDSSSPEPEGWQETDGHAITLVGVETDVEVLFVYGNWYEQLAQKGFDDADDHSCIDVTPGGTDCDPGTHQPQPTTCGTGACARTGQLTCPNGFFLDDCTPGLPAGSDASCDGVDDDCDGAPDEDFPSSQTSCGVGACASTGMQSCAGGHLQDNCLPGNPAPDDATCDGVDGDCDGSTDEDYQALPSQCGTGACAASGQLRCTNGSVQDTCQPGAPAMNDTTCDQRDDDCDGLTDEDCAGSDGGTGPGPDGGGGDGAIIVHPGTGGGCGCGHGPARSGVVLLALAGLFLARPRKA